VGWFISPVTNRYGKKRTAYASLLIGSMILSTFFFIKSPVAAIFVVFIASIFINLAYPAINSSYADYICDAPQVDGEIEGLEDFFVNVGYIFGPLMAGILADILNIPAAFSILGLIGVILAVVLLVAGPKHIIIKIKQSEL
jgi:MFS family permease